MGLAPNIQHATLVFGGDYPFLIRLNEAKPRTVYRIVGHVVSAGGTTGQTEEEARKEANESVNTKR